MIVSTEAAEIRIKQATLEMVLVDGGTYYVLHTIGIVLVTHG